MTTTGLALEMIDDRTQRMIAALIGDLEGQGERDMTEGAT